MHKLSSAKAQGQKGKWPGNSTFRGSTAEVPASFGRPPTRYSVVLVPNTAANDQKLAVYLLKAYANQVSSYEYSMVSACAWAIASVKKRLEKQQGLFVPIRLRSAVLYIAATNQTLAVNSLEANNR